jgi:hypothetical protein
LPHARSLLRLGVERRVRRNLELPQVRKLVLKDPQQTSAERSGKMIINESQTQFLSLSDPCSNIFYYLMK